MSEKNGAGQSGGVNISGTVGSVAGDIVGRDKIAGAPSTAELEHALGPLAAAIVAAPDETGLKAKAMLAELKQEAAKGERANDGVIARLVDGIVDLLPGAASTVISAFASPILGGIVGPVTGFVLDKLRAK